MNPLVLSGAARPLGTTNQDKSPSQAEYLAQRTPMEVGGAAGSSAQHWGGSASPLRRALMDEDPSDPMDCRQLNTARPREAARAETQLGLGAEYLGI